MDQIAHITTEYPILRDQTGPTLAAFYPLLEKNRQLITGVVKKTLKYGRTDRHCLDIYYPPAPTPPSEKTPILFFVYGGGFTKGDRNWAPPFELAYSNLGAFFSRKGFITVIPDYRLAPEFQYPTPAGDVLEAMKWVVLHPSDLASGTTPHPDVDSLILVGHSAGAAHAATLIFHPTLLPVDSSLRERIKAVIPVSGPFRFVPSAGEGDRAAAYYGTEEKAHEDSVLPLTLASLNVLPKEKLPKFLLVEAESEPGWIFNVGVEYRRLLEWYLSEPVEMIVGKGHNHVSLFASLSTGEGEEWGTQTADWIWKVLHNKEVPETNEGSTHTDIFGDVKDLDVFTCPKCQRQRNRSFTIQQEISKAFVICLDCGHKWTD